MLGTNDARTNAPVADPLNPTNAEIKDCLERVSLAKQLSNLEEGTNSQDIGERSVAAGTVILQRVLNDAGGQNAETLAAVVAQAINNACAPGGAIREVLTKAFLFRTLDTWDNRTRIHVEDALMPLPLPDGTNPANFPDTYGAFFSLSPGCLNSLLQAYGLPMNGTRSVKLACLVSFCNVQLST
jgi:hypothetical protein